MSKIKVVNKPGDNWFKIIKSNKSNLDFENYLLNNPIKYQDYHIYKATGKQRIVLIKDFLIFKYGGYIFFKKELYNNKEIDIIINYINTYFGGKIPYLSKPLPPKQIINRIIIKNNI